MRRPLFLVLIAGVTGCAEQASLAHGSVTRDSAGVTIVETAMAGWGDTSPWSVDTVPLLSIGSEEREDPYLLDRVAGAIRREDGSVIIGDGRSRELRLFDADGRHVSTHGRRGPGPGEFSRLERIAACGPDEVWVDSDSRVSIWSLDLEYRREFATADNPMWPLICFDGAGLVVKQDRTNLDESQFNIISTDSLVLFVVDSMGAGRRRLFDIALWSRVAVREGQNMLSMLHPLTPVTTLRGRGSELLVSRGEELRLDAYTMDGAWVRSSRGPLEDLALTNERREAYRSGPLTGIDSMWRHKLDLGGNPMPDRIPAVSELMVDSEGYAWVRRFVMPGSTANRWGVFDPSGAFLGHLQLPTGLEVMEIGREHVLGRTMDSLGVEQIRLHRLRR